MRPSSLLVMLLVLGTYFTAQPVAAGEGKPRAHGDAVWGVCEPLDRGLVARPVEGGKVYVGWRLLDSDPKDVAFNLYRRTGDADPVKLNDEPIRKTTNFVDASVARADEHAYFVRPIVDGKERSPSTQTRVVPGQAVAPYLHRRRNRRWRPAKQLPLTSRSSWPATTRSRRWALPTWMPTAASIS